MHYNLGIFTRKKDIQSGPEKQHSYAKKYCKQATLWPFFDQ